MLKVALISQKGGAGKTTLAVNLAAEGVRRGKRVLLVDLDPQGNATGWANRRGDRPPDVSAESPAALDVSVRQAEAEGYELLLFDTAPNADRIAGTAAKLSDLVLIPCRPATFDLDAVAATLFLCTVTKIRSAVVLNAAPIRSRVVDEARDQILAQRSEVSDVVVHQRVAFQHSLIDGRSAAEFEPDGAAMREIVELYDDMLTRLNADALTN